MEIVKVIGGHWVGRVGVVNGWVDGLYYQTVEADGEKMAIVTEWIERVEVK